jgi:hypothetical protein
LLLVFTQKIGAGLFLHTLLHSGKVAARHALPTGEAKSEISYNCSCIDDFLMPFEESDPVVVTMLLPVPVTHYVQPSTIIIPRAIVHTSLRGPPVVFS